MATQQQVEVSDTDCDFEELKQRMAIITAADESQYQSDCSLRRFLKAFRNVDDATMAIQKCNKWRKKYGVDEISPEEECIQKELIAGKAVILSQRDLSGRPVIYIEARKHNVNDRNIDEFTRFIVYILEIACRKCREDVKDNICIVFDLKDFQLQCMDYQFVKNLIWLLSKNYPERLGICLIINAPALFSGCWTVIRKMLSDATSEKVRVVNDEQELCKYLIPDILPDWT